MILIGSHAIKHWFPDFKRIPKDIDYVVLKERKNSIKGVEYLVNPILIEYYKEEIAEPNTLYTLKMSHIFWDINWSKHLYDLQFLKDKGCILDKELFYKLYEYW